MCILSIYSHELTKCNQAVVLLLLIFCPMYFQLFAEVLRLSWYCYGFLCVLSRFAIILLLLSYGCLVTVNDLLLHMIAAAYDVFFRFDYEDKLLEKMVRTEIQTQQVLETLDTAMNIIQGIKNYNIII